MGRREEWGGGRSREGGRVAGRIGVDEGGEGGSPQNWRTRSSGNFFPKSSSLHLLCHSFSIQVQTTGIISEMPVVWTTCMEKEGHYYMDSLNIL